MLQSTPYATGGSLTAWTLTTMDTAGRVIEVDHYSGSAPPAPWLPSGQTAPSNTGTATVAYDQTLSGCTGPATKSTDEAGNVKYTCSDGLDRLISVTEPNATSGAAGTVTTYGYDSFGNITSVDATSGGTQEPTLSCGHMRCFAYSGPLSRLMSASNPESGTTTYQYDNNGNLLKRTDANGTIMTVAAYDGLNRPTGISAGSPAVTYVPGSVTTPSGTYNVAATPSVTYTYDAGFKGALSSVANSASTTSYAYDGFGRISGSTQTMGASGPSYTFGYKYSLTDTLNSMTYPSGRQVDYQLDSADRVTTVQNVTGGGDYASSIGYTPNSDLSGMTLGNGVTQNFTWNDRLQPTGMTATGGGATLLGLGFFPCSGGATSCATNAGAGTGNNGNLLSQTITMPVPGQPQNPLNLTQSYTYDHLNRITGAQETGGGANWSQAYGYDVLGNRWVSSNTGLPNLPLETPVASSWYSTTLPNRYAAWTYDNTGNVLQMGSVVNSFTYDAENRQVTACFNCAVGSPTGTYAYDGIGQRVSKTAGGQTTTYVYAAFGNVAAEYSTGAVTSACGTPTCYVTTDHLGSTRMLTSSAGAVGSRYDYQPFGLEIPAGYDGRTTGMGFLSTPDATNPKYTGQERDQETTLDNFLVRYYDPAQGRFQSPDPGNVGADLSNPQSWNGFGYVGNNPLSFTDPSGMFTCVSCVADESGNPIVIGIAAAIDIGSLLAGLFEGLGGPPPTIPPALAMPSSPILGSDSDQGGVFGSGNTSPLVFNLDPTQQTGFSFGWNWFWGNLPPRIYYPARSRATKDMRRSSVVQRIRAQYISNGCPAFAGPLASGHLEPWKESARNMVVRNTTQFEVGGFVMYGTTSSDGATVTYTIRNTASWSSFAGESTWGKHVGLTGDALDNKLGTFGRNVEQIFTWSEPNPCAK